MAPKSQATFLINDCLSTIGDIPGCVQEVITSFLTLQIRIGPECCKALLDIEDNCWRQVFPLITSTFPSLIRTFCTASPPPHQYKVQVLSARDSMLSPEPAAWAPEEDVSKTKKKSRKLVKAPPPPLPPEPPHFSTTLTDHPKIPHLKTLVSAYPLSRGVPTSKSAVEPARFEIQPFERWTTGPHVPLRVFEAFELPQDFSSYVDRSRDDVAERCLTRAGQDDSLLT
ncbi:hypothetical protein POM88_017622 [Heracleum sosnowskyi]|uniref:Prolamin-like domain-containing protein n=1 Tax=Heracleum sosnowskyi TaxID=360622 RepID=A0AAD8IQU6_9APIA|nr:hypothetical protein POM88_017622 [Heracleum sosnowskyi]